MENISAHRDLFQFTEILQFIHVLLRRGVGREGWEGIEVELASTSVGKCNRPRFLFMAQIRLLVQSTNSINKSIL